MYTYEDKTREWGFIEMLKKPLHVHMPLGWAQIPKKEGAVSLAGGLRMERGFEDKEGLLDTAYEDFDAFLACAGLTGGAYPVRTGYMEGEKEAYTIRISEDGCEILGGDTEAIRRGIYYLEDEIKRQGMQLMPGSISRRAFVKSRISRCFWGPIKRPPMNRDELADDEDYYPDNYLNRLAHDGVNGVWITISFKDLLPSKIIPEYTGKGAEKKIAKLQATCEKCRRYGVGVYAFCIEPAGFDKEMAEKHPDMTGIWWGPKKTFCTGTEKGLAYLEESFRTLFELVPGLKGVINITTGESQTHCYSPRITVKGWKPCERCARFTPVESVKRNIEAMVRGVRAASPDAEFISWPYSQYNLWGHDLTVESAAATPEGACFCANFESGGDGEQLGKERRVTDYWLSYVGPAKLYERIAEAVAGTGQRMFAKLQVGCSHEVATVPFVPVPGNLYRKYEAMKRLGVSGAMQCWYFGNYPSVMTKAAGELAFETFEEGEDAFLKKMAQTEYGVHADAVVHAWKLFSEAYENYPLNAFFGYYGPMHDGPVWPLYPEPVNLPTPPSWELKFPPAGDRVGEAFLNSHTFDEVVYLCDKLDSLYSEGMAALTAIRGSYEGQEDVLLDFDVCRALGLQFKSGADIMRFYKIREDMYATPKAQRPAMLRMMKDIIAKEIKVSRDLAVLSAKDSRLGFHSESEGHRYDPEKLEWRAQLLEKLLREDMPRLEQRAKDGLELYPEYCGESPEYKNVSAVRMSGNPYDEASWADVKTQADFTVHGTDTPDDATGWQAAYDDEKLYIRITGAAQDVVYLKMEPRPLSVFPAYSVSHGGESEFMLDYDINETMVEGCEFEAVTVNDSTVVAIGLEGIGRGKIKQPLRINVVRPNRNARWVDKPNMKPRMVFEGQNTTEYGYLKFE